MELFYKAFTSYRDNNKVYTLMMSTAFLLTETTLEKSNYFIYFGYFHLSTVIFLIIWNWCERLEIIKFVILLLIFFLTESALQEIRLNRNVSLDFHYFFRGYLVGST